jgi:integration host factor subunit beta
MTKSELIKTLAQDQGLSAKMAASIVNTILDTMIEALVKGDNIELRGFGSFTVREYETYTGRNPKTGSLVTVKPKKLPFFKVGKDLKESIEANRSS